MPIETLSRLFKDYGPIAFGVVALLVLWKTIVGPELDAARAQASELNKAVNSLHSTALIFERSVNAQEQIARSMEQTAKVLDRTSMRLDLAESKRAPADK